MAVLIGIAEISLAGAALVLLVYAVRHHWLAVARLNAAHPRDGLELAGFHLPKLSVIVPMHNEERVAADVLQALVECDYDPERLEILAINDRSSDYTGAILNDFAVKHPAVRVIHRDKGQSGKPAVLAEACAQASGEIILVFDADYVPGRAMLKLLAAPFCDPEVGAVMGRVVPFNTGESLLAGLLSLERAAGYQCGQQARYHLGLTALFGGTVGGVRASALRAVGGWDTSSLAEDTDLTCRLNLQGWKVAYVNRAECYEEVPASWRVRRRQLMRWAGGHTECLHRYWLEICRCPFLSRMQKVDAVLMLACYWTAPIMVLGWMASVVLLFAQHPFGGAMLAASLAFLGYQLFAGQAAFVELGTAALLDGSGRRILLLPLNLLNFFASTSAICEALLRYYGRRIAGSDGPAWDKTGRSRESNGPGKP